MKNSWSIITILSTIVSVKEDSAEVLEESPPLEEQMKLPGIFDVNNFSLTMNEEFTELYTTSIDEHGDLSILWSNKKDGQSGLFEPITSSKHEYNDIDPFLSRDESLLVYYSAKEGGLGGSDLYLSKKIDGVWAKAVNLGKEVNSRHVEYCPYITNICFYALG